MGSKFSIEFKKQAISMVMDKGVTAGNAAKEMGVGYSTLDKWVRNHRERLQDPNALSEPELAELKRLRKENLNLRIERDLLKKMAQYFAKDSDPK